MYALKAMSFWAIAALALGSSLIFAEKFAMDCHLRKSFEFTTRAEISGLAGSIDWIVPGLTYSCPDDVKIATKALSSIVNSKENLCSQETANRIRDFHVTYLASERERVIKLPKPLKQFFIAYALKFSQLCRRAAVANLVEASNRLFESSNFELVGEKGVFAELTREPIKYNDLALPEHVIKLLKLREHGFNSERLYLQVGSTEEVSKLKLECASKFRPVYEKVLQPLVTVATRGYNFHDGSSDAPATAPEPDQFGKRVFQWYRIATLCEVIDSIQLIKAEAGQDTSSVSILSKKEAETLRQKSPELFVDSEQSQAGEPVAYEPDYSSATQVADPIVDMNNKKLIKAIIKFDYFSRVHNMGTSIKGRVASAILEKIIQGKIVSLV